MSDPLKDEVRRTLRDLHAPQPVPPFGATWAAAEQMLDHERRTVPRARLGARSWRYAPVWSGMAAAAALALTIVLLWQPPADEHPPLADEPARGTGEPMPRAVAPAARADDSAADADHAVADANQLANVRRPGFNVTSRSMMSRAHPVMWYAPTDRLLQVASLSYTARPAVLTVYDPIHLEIRP